MKLHNVEHTLEQNLWQDLVTARTQDNNKELEIFTWLLFVCEEEICGEGSGARTKFQLP